MASALAMGLALAACACHRAEPAAATGRAAVPSRTTYGPALQTYPRQARQQYMSLRWNRPGDWTPIKVAAPDRSLTAALVARDRFGDRILALRPKSGYDLQLAHIDCDHHGIVLLEQRNQASDRQAADPSVARAVPTPVATTPIEVARICAKAPIAMNGTPSQVASRLRLAGTRAAAPPAPLAPAERERMWREYQAREAANK